MWNAWDRGTDCLSPGEKRPWLALHPEKQGVLVLCEGVFDAIAVYKLGFDACAIHGQSVPWPHIPSGDLLILLDRDAAGRAREVALEALALGRKAIPLSHGLLAKDPDEADPSELLELLQTGLRELSATYDVRMRGQLRSIRTR